MADADKHPVLGADLHLTPEQTYCLRQLARMKLLHERRPGETFQPGMTLQCMSWRIGDRTLTRSVVHITMGTVRLRFSVVLDDQGRMPPNCRPEAAVLFDADDKLAPEEQRELVRLVEKAQWQ